MREPHGTDDGAAATRVEWLIVGLGALLPMLPVLPAPGRLVTGVPFSDVHKHVWGYWHVIETIREGGWPWTSWIRAPCGGVLLDPMTVPALLLAPVTLLGGPALADNVWLGLSLLLTGGVVMALSRELGASGLASAVAGAIAPTSPFLVAYPLDSGVRERVAIWLFPLLVLTLLRLYRRPAWGLGLLSLFWVFVAVMGAQFYGFLAVLMLPLAALLGLGRRPGLRGLLRGALWLGAVAAVIGGVYLWTDWARAHPWSLVTSTAPSSGKVPSFAFVGEWLGLLLNPVAAHAARARVLNDTLYQVSYLGWVPILAGALAIVLPAPPGGAAPGRRLSSALLFCLVVTFSGLAVGPVLGRSGVSNPLYALVQALVPWEGHGERAWQDVAVVLPFLAIAAARLVDHLPRGRARGVGAAVGVGLVLLERGLVMPVPLMATVVDMRVPPPYERIAADAGPGLVLDAPRFRGETDLSPGEPFIAQTLHRHPIPWGINPDGHDPIRSLEEAAAIGRCGEGGWAEAAPELRRLGVRWIVLHPAWCADPTRAARWVESARAAFGAPLAGGEAEGEGLLLFSLSGVSSETPEECSLAPAER